MFILAHKSDLPRLGHFDSSIPLAVLEGFGAGMSVSLDGVPVPDFQLYPGLLLGIALTDESHQALETLSARVSERFACAPPAVADLTDSPENDVPAQASAAVIAALQAELDRVTAGNVALTRAIAAVRGDHERTQAAFARLENFVLGNNLAKRTECLSLLPARELGSILLSQDSAVEQRLPVGSSGLSDIGLFVADVECPQDGMLTVSLRTVEDDVLHATWQVLGDALVDGRIRLTLPVGLSVEQLTPSLQVAWTGDGVVRLAVAMFHPDPRFQAHVAGVPDGRVLACRLWSYIPGCEAPIPAVAILPTEAPVRPLRKRVLDAETLHETINLVPDNPHFRVLPENDALLVHPMGGAVSAAVVPGALAATAALIRAQILTRSAEAQDIEYAMAIAPADLRPAPGEALPPFSEDAVTGWVRLPPQETGDLLLPVTTPLDGPHDLYLMTRLPKGGNDASHALATFGPIMVTE